MSHLLLDSAPLVVIPELAVCLGLNEAIIVQQIHYWIQVNERANRNASGGYYWTYNTYEQWAEQFPFWSVKTIKRTISRLESAGILITGHFNKSKMDQTKWYRIDYGKLPTSTRETADESGGRDGKQVAERIHAREGSRIPTLPDDSRELSRSGQVDPIEVSASVVAVCDPIDRDNLSPCIGPNERRSLGRVVPIEGDELTHAIPETYTETNTESLSRDDERHSTRRQDEALTPEGEPAGQGDIGFIEQIAAPLLQRTQLNAEEKRMLVDLLATGVSTHHMIEGIRQAFDAYKPRYAGDRIYKLTYCRLPILQAAGVYSVDRSGRSGQAAKGSGRGASLVQPDKYEKFWQRYRERDGPESHGAHRVQPGKYDRFYAAYPELGRKPNAESTD
ncbi:MAG: hypothetical protein OWT28_02535 [Firmicutes bacterium]|nr:hypothetical protein [Bacillota bacterium]